MKYSRKKRRYADVLAEIHDIHDSFTEEEYYDALYYILGDTYPDASDEELEEIFEEMLENMSEQQAEDFMSSLGSIGKKIGSGLAQVPNFLGKNPELLSTIGGIAGNLILPGAGGMIGGALGSAAGGLLQNKNAQNNLQQQQQQNPNAIVNPDAAKLNSLMQDPQMQRALMQMSTSNVPIAPLTSNGQTTHVPIANFLHALIRQAQAALQQLDALIPPQVQEALAENFGEDFAGEDLGEALLEEVRVNGGWEGRETELDADKKPQTIPITNKILKMDIFLSHPVWGKYYYDFFSKDEVYTTLANFVKDREIVIIMDIAQYQFPPSVADAEAITVPKIFDKDKEDYTEIPRTGKLVTQDLKNEKLYFWINFYNYRGSMDAEYPDPNDLSKINDLSRLRNILRPIIVLLHEIQHVYISYYYARSSNLLPASRTEHAFMKDEGGWLYKERENYLKRVFKRNKSLNDLFENKYKEDYKSFDDFLKIVLIDPLMKDFKGGETGTSWEFPPKLEKYPK